MNLAYKKQALKGIYSLKKRYNHETLAFFIIQKVQTKYLRWFGLVFFVTFTFDKFNEETTYNTK